MITVSILPYCQRFPVLIKNDLKRTKTTKAFSESSIPLYSMFYANLLNLCFPVDMNHRITRI